MKILLIDDVRDLSADRTARSYKEGLKALKKEEWDLLYLDHDLASFDRNGRELTGYDILEWILKHPQCAPGRIQLVSLNPVGLRRMKPLVSQIENLKSSKWIRYRERALRGGPCRICGKPIDAKEVTMNPSETDKSVFLHIFSDSFSHLKHVGVGGLFTKVLEDLAIDLDHVPKLSG